MVQTEHSPHYSELARDLGVSHEESQAVLCDLMATGYPGWLDANTNWIITLCPFSNVPNQYRITVEGEQKWFGQ